MEKMTNSNIAVRLKELRIEKGFLQDQVAELVGVARNAVSSYENGARQPSLDILVALARVYKTTTDYILGITDRRQLDISGLTSHQIELVSDLVSELSAKNKH